MFLTCTIILSLFSGMGLTALAASGTHPSYSKEADRATLDGWKAYFGTTHPSTENAGAVWTDKSVFADNSAFMGLTDANNHPITPEVAEDSFLVALSALASNKSVVGHSSIPTDTVLLLDISGSMGPKINDAVADLVLAANAAVTELLKLNVNNRVGVILYSAKEDYANDAHYYNVLPIGRYSATTTVTHDNGTPNDTADDMVVGEFFTTNATNVNGVTDGHNGTEFSVAPGVTDAGGNPVDEMTANVIGGTYIQGGIGAVADMFKGRHDAQDTVVQGDGFQGDIQRKPVVVLMTDGAPTFVSTDYTDPKDYNKGDGSNTNAGIVFLTQLTAAYEKQKISEYYNNTEALFYTLGLGVESNVWAESVLDPANADPAIDTLWESYQMASPGITLEVMNGDDDRNDISITKVDGVDDLIFADRYFAADNPSELFAAFQNIVHQIVVQSQYHPTLVGDGQANASGYIEFIDDVGDYMKVQQIEGILIGNKLHTGEKLCENFTATGGELGSVAAPSALGDNLIWSIQERLGIDDVKTARELVALAYQHGQLSYTDEDTYSNYIGWYGDSDNQYVGFWDESHTYEDMPANAKYVNKSYGMLGQVTDDENVSDLMYISIQVHTEILSAAATGSALTDVIAPGHCELRFRIPAALIPVVNYEITVDGSSYLSANDIQMEIRDAEPIRLLFEVGLRNDINEYNIEEKLGADRAKYLVTDVNDPDYGKYRFYTNEWSVQQFQKSISTDPNDYVSPQDAINTVSFFEPNYSNERYYYTEPAMVFLPNPNGYDAYFSDIHPKDVDQEYYRRIDVFRLTADRNDGNKAEWLRFTFEPISDLAIQEAVRNENGNWIIPKGTVRRINETAEILKTDESGVADNVTDTLDYAAYLTVKHRSGVHYYAETLLGNNGVLTVTPATGIKIEKAMDAALAGTSAEFQFDLSVTNAADHPFRLIYCDPDGNFTVHPGNHALDTNGNTTVSLQAGWSAYVVDLPVWESYTVTEQDSRLYEPVVSSGTTGVIEQNRIHPVQFVNALKQDGYLVISKRVEHPFAITPAGIENQEFLFNVSLTLDNETYPDQTVNAFYSSDLTTPVPLTVANNRIEGVVLRDGESIIIPIENGWKAAVSEDESVLPTGFAPDHQQTVIPNDITVTSSQNVTYQFVNTYTPAPVSPDMTIAGEKELTGRPWNNDTFRMVLRRYDPVTAEYKTVENGIETVTDPVSGKVAAFGATLTAAMRAEEYQAPGTYRYSVVEEVPANKKGVTYDTLSRDFDVVVTDENLDGKLEIKAVQNTKAATVASANNHFDVTLDRFVNSYRAVGVAELTLQVQKQVALPEGGNPYDLSGFEFGIYDRESEELRGITQITDQSGLVQLRLAYPSTGIDYQNERVYEYLLRETDARTPGMIYAEDIPFTVTVRDNLDGTVRAIASIGTVDQSGVYVTAMTNEYRPSNTRTAARIHVQKKIINNGSLPLTPDGYSIDLLGGEVGAASQQLQQVTDVNGETEFSFDYTEADLGKTYAYFVTEVAGSMPGMVYSTERYYVRVEICLEDKTNRLIPVITVNGEAVSGDTATVEFVNVYAPAPVSPDITVKAEKELVGRPWKTDSFRFVLKRYDPDLAQYLPVAGGTETVTDPVSGQVAEFGSVLTAALNAEVYTAAGTYRYQVVELVPDQKKGITFDTAPREFSVVVADDDLDGRLEIKAVNDTVMASFSNGVVTLDRFVNSYVASGAAELTLQIDKRVFVYDGAAPYDRSGFEFGLYDRLSGAQIGELQVTDQNGQAKFTLTFPSDGVSYTNTHVYQYLIRETDKKVAGVTYATDIPVTVTVWDNLDGTIGADANIGQKKRDGTRVLVVVNHYRPSDTTDTVRVLVTKKVENHGKWLVTPDGFCMALSGGEVGKTPQVLQQVTDQKGKAYFDLEYTENDVGKTFEYVVTEVPGTLKNITYSDAEYRMTVEVYQEPGTNRVRARVIYGGEVMANNVVRAEFVNISYRDTPNDPPVNPPANPPAETPSDPTRPEAPQTGDTAHLALWIALLFVSGTGMFSGFLFGKKARMKP